MEQETSCKERVTTYATRVASSREPQKEARTSHSRGLDQRPTHAPDVSYPSTSLQVGHGQVGVRHGMPLQDGENEEDSDARAEASGQGSAVAGVGGEHAAQEGAQAQEGEGEAEGRGKGDVKAGHANKDVAFVLRKLYTGGGLDAQQQGWKALPVDLFNTLTLQLGTMSKVLGMI